MKVATSTLTHAITSYPRGKIKILLLENIHTAAAEQFFKKGYTNIEQVAGSLSEDELIQKLKGIRLLGIRSKTNLTEKVIREHASGLLAVGCFCIGTNQVDIHTANQSGIAVFNAPYSNTRSVAELVVGAIVVLLRRLVDTSVAMHQGIWSKTANGSHEVRGKRLGIVGYGNIGSQLSVLAEALGMQVAYYDAATKLPHGNAKPVSSLKQLLASSDIISLNVPSTEATHHLMNKHTLRMCKPGAVLINYARGTVVNHEDLTEALHSQHLAGAAIDVFPNEPQGNTESFTSPLQGLPNVLLTPHIAGSTQEAQQHIARDVSERLIDFLEYGSTLGSKSLPELQANPASTSHRILHIHHNKPGIISRISSILYNNNINIKAQELRSNAEVGYAILDVGPNLSREAYLLLRDIPDTIQTRLLY